MMRSVKMNVGNKPVGTALTWAYPNGQGYGAYVIPTYQLTVITETLEKDAPMFQAKKEFATEDTEGNGTYLSLLKEKYLPQRHGEHRDLYSFIYGSLCVLCVLCASVASSLP